MSQVEQCLCRAFAGIEGDVCVGDISIIFPCSFAVGITQQSVWHIFVVRLSDLYGA